MNRREFLQLCGAFTLSAQVGNLVCAVDGMATATGGTPLFSRTRLAMGTFVTITIAGASQTQAEQAAGLAFATIERLSRVFNEFDPATPLSVLNQQGSLKDAPPELTACLRLGAACHRQTGGAFDPTVKPVLDMFRRNGADTDVSRLPLDLIGYDMVEVRKNAVTLPRSGMGLTLNGSAKGFIADRAGEAMEQCGVSNYLLDAGGDIRARGSKHTASRAMPWRVAITDPRPQKDRLAVLELHNQCLATSGGYEVFFDREKTHHHIIDPRTGDSPRHSLGTSVVADSLAQADALATAAMVMVPRQAAQCLRQARTRAWLVEKNGVVTV